MQFSQAERAAPSSGVAVQLNWKPIGRLGKSAETITAWLGDQGCTEFSYRLESGSEPEELK